MFIWYGKSSTRRNRIHIKKTNKKNNKSFIEKRSHWQNHRIEMHIRGDWTVLWTFEQTIISPGIGSDRQTLNRIYSQLAVKFGFRFICILCSADWKPQTSWTVRIRPCSAAFNNDLFKYDGNHKRFQFHTHKKDSRKKYRMKSKRNKINNSRGDSNTSQQCLLFLVNHETEKS